VGNEDSFRNGTSSYDACRLCECFALASELYGRKRITAVVGWSQGVYPLCDETAHLSQKDVARFIVSDIIALGKKQLLQPVELISSVVVTLTALSLIELNCRRVIC
jgi:hypothetical protein